MLSRLVDGVLQGAYGWFSEWKKLEETLIPWIERFRCSCMLDSMYLFVIAKMGKESRQ